MSTPSTWAVTAYFRIAPTAMRNREVPIVTAWVVVRRLGWATGLAGWPAGLLPAVVDVPRERSQEAEGQRAEGCAVAFVLQGGGVALRPGCGQHRGGRYWRCSGWW